MSFNKIIGQTTAIKSLKNIIAQDQVRGAYIFLGPDGVGKRTISIEFAKTINCENKRDDACDSCISCRKIDSMNHPDVWVIEPEGASNSIKIDKIREIIYQASLKPYEGKKRVFILVDAEAMTEEAQNALLKLLEEPPQNHILIVTLSNISGILPTVLSRCRVLKFNFLNQSRIREILLSRNVDEKEADLFSHMAMGSIGRAVSFKEKDIITQRDRVVNDFFLKKSALLRENVLLEEVNGDVEENLYLLLCWYRDMLIARTISPLGRGQGEGCELLNIDRAEEIFSYANRFTRERLEKDVLKIMDTIGYVRGNINPKIAVFNMAVGLKVK